MINHISGSRLFEEITKLYHCGEAVLVQKKLIQYGLFSRLFQQTHELLDGDKPVHALLSIAFENTDHRIKDNKPVTPAFIFAVLLWFPLLSKVEELKLQGIDPLPALEKSMALVIAEQNKVIMVPKRFTQVIREIWLLQYRFTKRTGNRAYHLLEHPRFRAAYDFLAIRALAGDEAMELADWWTKFQDVDPQEQALMIDALTPAAPPPKRRRKAKNKS